MSILISPLSAAASRPNAILIVIDALAKSHLQSFGYFRETSPFLLSLGEQSVFFTDAVAASSQTASSMASILTGKYPHNNGVQYFGEKGSFHPVVPLYKGGFPKIGPDIDLIYKSLKASGYKTYVIQTNPWMKSEYGFSPDVDVYHYHDYHDNYDGATVIEYFFDKIIPKFGGEEFFAYIHLMDVHSPYYKPATFKGMYTSYNGDPVYENKAFPGLSKDTLDYTIAFYDEGIRHVDEIIRSFFNRLAEKGLRENTLVTIVSDHGDEFMQHGGLGHGRTLYNEVKDSMIIINHPHLAPKNIDVRVSLVDVFPTILDWMKVNYRKKSVDGISLWPLIEREKKMKKRMIYSELGDIKAILDEDIEVIYDDNKNRWEIYDLKTDREELRSIPSVSIKNFKKYVETTRKIVAEAERRIRTSEAADKEYQRLKSLGYIK